MSALLKPALFKFNPESTLRPKLLVGALLLAGGVGLALWEFRQRERWPCEYQAYDRVMHQYPSLARLRQDQQQYLDSQAAAGQILDARIELAVKRGALTEEQALQLEQWTLEQTMAGWERYERQLQSECRRLTADRGPVR